MVPTYFLQVFCKHGVANLPPLSFPLLPRGKHPFLDPRVGEGTRPRMACWAGAANRLQRLITPYLSIRISPDWYMQAHIQSTKAAIGRSTRRATAELHAGTKLRALLVEVAPASISPIIVTQWCDLEALLWQFTISSFYTFFL